MLGEKSPAIGKKGWVPSGIRIAPIAFHCDQLPMVRFDLSARQ